MYGRSHRPLRSLAASAARTRRVSRIIWRARYTLMGSSTADTNSVRYCGCSAPKITKPTLPATASQRSGIIVLTKAAPMTKDAARPPAT